MQLNTIKPAAGAKHAKKRVGRGIGSGLGKTAGLGHKWQKARAGGYHKVGFEGGQMPLQRRLPKRGFVSPLKHDTAEVRLSDLNKLDADIVDILALKAAGIVPIHALSAKVIVSGELKRKVTLHGLLVSKGAKAAVEAAGGKIELPVPAVAAPPVPKAPAGETAAAATAQPQTPGSAEPAAKAAGGTTAPKPKSKSAAAAKAKPKPAARKTKKAH